MRADVIRLYMTAEDKLPCHMLITTILDALFRLIILADLIYSDSCVVSVYSCYDWVEFVARLIKRYIHCWYWYHYI